VRDQVSHPTLNICGPLQGDEIKVMCIEGNQVSGSFWYSCLLGLLAPVTDGLSCVQEPLAIGRKGCAGGDLTFRHRASSI
jgi:hypothetical protein